MYTRLDFVGLVAMKNHFETMFFFFEGSSSRQLMFLSTVSTFQHARSSSATAMIMAYQNKRPEQNTWNHHDIIPPQRPKVSSVPTTQGHPKQGGFRGLAIDRLWIIEGLKGQVLSAEKVKLCLCWFLSRAKLHRKKRF